MSIIAYHLTGERLRDGRPIPTIGEWLIHTGPVKMCKSGLHASRHPFDALFYAPGPILHLVECRDIVDEEDDKLVCRRRRIIRSGDASEMLRYFARMQAISVLDHWRCAPPDVVLDWLMTGDDAARSAAESAARNAARSAARNAAESAAESAAWSAARSAARSAAWSAAESAARNAARSAARKQFADLVNEFFH